MNDDKKERTFIIILILFLSICLIYSAYSFLSQTPLECEDDEYKLIFCSTSQPIGDDWVEEPDGTWAMCVKFYDNETINGESLNESNESI